MTPPITDGETATPEPVPDPIRRPSSSDLLAGIDESMRADPAFRVLTVEGTHWIDPFTGKCIPAPGGNLAPAREYLAAERPWTRARLKRLGELQIFRWRLFMHHYVDRDWRLRQFAADGRWLNPFSGAWVHITKVDGAITPATLREMATHLANCQHAASGRMLPQRHLDTLISAARPAESKCTTRISGWRAGQPETRTFTAQPPTDPALARLHETIEHMLPQLPSVTGFGFAVHHEPFTGVGGDFYDCTRLDDHRWFIAIGDVSGHGEQSAQAVITALNALHDILSDEHDLVEIIAGLNEVVRRDLARGQFITLFAAIFDARTRRLTCQCAGHHPGLLASRSRPSVLTRIGHRGPALGLVDSDALRTALVPEEVRLKDDDLVLLYTDGLSEARDGLRTEYGDCRVMASVVARLDSPYDRLVAGVVDEARRFAEGVLEDDLTVMALAVQKG